MKKVVLKYGLISGAIILVSSAFWWGINGGADMDMGAAEISGWVSMLLALSMVYFGIRAHRMAQEDKTIRFGTGFAIGALISLVATVVWAVGWEIMMAGQMTEFMENYGAYVISGMEADGATVAEIAEAKADNEYWAELFKNPFYRVLMSASEIFPVGLLVSIGASVVESRRGA